MFEEVFRRKAQKKGGLRSPPFLYANIQLNLAISKSAFRTVFTKVNKFAMFLLSHILQKVVLNTNAVLRTKIEMLEYNQSKIFSSVYYEMAAEASLQLRN